MLAFTGGTNHLSNGPSPSIPILPVYIIKNLPRVPVHQMWLNVLDTDDDVMLKLGLANFVFLKQ